MESMDIGCSEINIINNRIAPLTTSIVVTEIDVVSGAILRVPDIR